MSRGQTEQAGRELPVLSTEEIVEGAKDIAGDVLSKLGDLDPVSFSQAELLRVTDMLIFLNMKIDQLLEEQRLKNQVDATKI